MLIETWDRSSLGDQEEMIGLARLSGAPLRAKSEHGPATGELDAGRFFVCFERDPHAQSRRPGTLRRDFRMSFDVSADAYDRFMGRYSASLSPQLADLAGVAAGQRAVDVGCGSGMLTAELVARLGAGAVAAIDPSAPFVEAIRARFPGVDVRRGTAEDLPFEDGEFDAALSQLVVHFMRDAVQGLREMARVTRPGGAVAASVWDLAGGRAPISPFWRAAVALDPNARDEMAVTGGRAGHLGALFAEAGIERVRAVEHPAVVEHQTFDEWFGPFTLGVGPAGSYLVGIDEERQAAVRERCRAELGDGPFTIPSFVWAAVGVSPAR